MTRNINFLEEKTDPNYRLRLHCMYIWSVYFILFYFSRFALVKTWSYFIFPKIRLVKSLFFLSSRYKIELYIYDCGMLAPFIAAFSCFPGKYIFHFHTSMTMLLLFSPPGVPLSPLCLRWICLPLQKPLSLPLRSPSFPCAPISHKALWWYRLK